MRKEKSLVKNIAYNMVSQVVALIVPLITAPYIARVFNPEIIGSYSYALAVSSYFVLFECLGFPLYGQIQVAAYRNDKSTVTRLFWEIMLAKIMLMAFSIVCYAIIIGKPQMTTEYILKLIMMVNILANGLDVTWFLNGLEEFRVIAIRSIVVRLVNVVCIFVLISQEQDIILYALFMQGATLIANLSVYPIVFKEISWEKVEKLNLLCHFKPASIYFVPGLVTTIFSSTDKTMLGIFSNNYEVGVYEQANKISNICMSAISAIGNVILPRASHLYHSDKNYADRANTLVYKSFNLVVLIAMPVTFGMAAISKEFVPVFFGNGYEKSVQILELLCCNVLLTSSINLLGQQCLIARKKQKEYNYSIVLSAIVNVVFNYLLIRSLDSIGAAIASVAASVISLCMILLFSKVEISLKKLFSVLWKYLLSSIVMYILVSSTSRLLNGTIEGILVRCLLGASMYFFVLICLKEDFMWLIIKRFAAKHCNGEK